MNHYVQPEPANDPARYLSPIAHEYIRAARATSIEPQIFGLWCIEKVGLQFASRRNPMHDITVWQTVLRRLPGRTIVMEDSNHELSKHLPIWMAAAGRVLVTGLGLGCVVRGLLSKPQVTHIDVVDRDPGILRVVGAEFEGNPRVTLHLGDALKMHWPRAIHWDYAWHDLWSRDDEPHLQLIHAQVLAKYQDHADHQGAWELPRWICDGLRRNVGRRGGNWLLR